MMDDLDQFKDTYITECNELLEDMEERLLGIDESDPDLEDVNAVFRCAHSIKGGAGAFGLTEIGGFTHILEELLDAMRNSEVQVTREIIDLLLASAEVVKEMVATVQQGDPVPETLGQDLAIELRKVVAEQSGGGAASEEAPAESSEAPEEAPSSDASSDSSAQDPNPTGTREVEIGIYDIEFKPHKGLFLTGNEPLFIIRELKELGSLEVYTQIDELPEFDKLEPESCYVWWKFVLEAEATTEKLTEVFEFVEDECDLTINRLGGYSKQVELTEEEKAAQQAAVEASKEPQESDDQDNNAPQEETAEDKQKVEEEKKPAPAKAKSNKDKAAKAPVAASIRVDVDKIDRLVNLVGELVINQAMISSQADKLPKDKFFGLLNGISELSQHMVELQEAVMAVRMMPVKSVFSRMSMLVRDLSAKLGKNIRMDMAGENTELDKTVIEQLTDPLTHMIRNSVDHGIATPEVRLEQGKPEEGVIKLTAEHSGGRILIRIEDDGNGIERQRVLDKAVEKGLISEDAELSDHEIDNLIFMAGFSTAEAVSDISGRGVGMDVVRRNIESLGGTVTIDNNPGVGNAFIIVLPLTLAILDGMIVRVGNEKYVIPIGSIVETLRPSSEDIQKIADKSETINVRGEFVPILYLYQLFNIQDAKHTISDGLVILLENGDDKFGLVVDELIGQQQVVIKSLEENSFVVPGISAATILGDGRVSLILDVAGVRNMETPMALAEVS